MVFGAAGLLSEERDLAYLVIGNHFMPEIAYFCKVFQLSTFNESQIGRTWLLSKL